MLPFDPLLTKLTTTVVSQRGTDIFCMDKLLMQYLRHSTNAFVTLTPLKLAVLAK